MTNIKAIVIRGDFTEAEFAALVALIRQMDDARPGADFEITAVDPTEHSLEIAEQTLRRMVPERPGRKMDWVALKREQDEPQ